MKREDFPALMQSEYAWLDNAATTHKPHCVLEMMQNLYIESNANVHRSPHRPGREMTRIYEEARETVCTFFKTRGAYEAIFTRGTTEAINLVAYSCLFNIACGDGEVLTTVAEHHSNFVVWQQLCQRMGLRLRVVPVLPDGRLDMEAYYTMLNEKTRIVAVAHVTNTFGMENPVTEIIRLARDKGVPVLLDGAQAAGHRQVDLAALDCDFYCASAHKLYGPTGVGVLLAKKNRLDAMPPFQFGGEMIERVSLEKTLFQPPPYRFEAGTPDFIGAAGFARALKYIEETGGMEAVETSERKLTTLCWTRLHELESLHFPIDRCPDAGIISFLPGKLHPYDAAVLLDRQLVAVRSGKHCAHPLMDALGLAQGTVRVSLAAYNTPQDIDRLYHALERIMELHF